MVKKFYMETKDSTLESAILDVWKNAAENNMSGEDSFEVGTDRYREHTQKMTPGQMKEEIAKLDSLIEELEEGILGNITKAAGKTVVKGIKDASKKVKDTVVSKAKGTLIGKAVGKVGAGIKRTKDIAGKVKKAARTGKAYGDEYNPMLERLEVIESKLNEYRQVLEEEMAQSTNGQEQLKGLRETILDMWKEAADTHVDPKDREELDKAPENTAKKMKRATEPKPMIATEALDKVDKKELKKDFDKRAKDGDADIDNDGDEDDSDKFLHKKRKAISKAIGAKKEDAELDEYITKEGTRRKVADGDGRRMSEGGMKRGKDLKTFKPKPKKEEVEEELTIPQAQEFKVSSMKLALAKVWGLDEGELPPALKKAIDAKKKNGDEDEDKEESVKKGGKTETGKKKAEIEIDPELKEKNKK